MLTLEMATQDRIKVLARIRPLSSKEISRGDGGGIHSVTGGQCIHLEHSSGATTGKRFVLDAVMDEDSSQEEVFSQIQPFLENAIQGYNTTIFTCNKNYHNIPYTNYTLVILMQMDKPVLERHLLC